MNSSARPPRVIRSAAARAEADVFVVGTSTPAIPIDATVATAEAILAAAQARAAELIAAAEDEAARILATTGARLAEAADRGFADGLARAESECSDLLELLRAAAREGLAIRDQVAASSSALLTNAVILATRRLVGQAYAADPALTAVACEEAVRSAAGQEILSIRVNPEAEASVTAALGDLGAYVRPDASIHVGGCIVDLRNGTIDATLDARLQLAELAIRRATGADA